MRTNTFVHKYLKGLLTKEDSVVDMTAGNGNDTLLLARLAKDVIAFDISEEAIRNTAARVRDFDNVKLICDDHVNVDKYIDKDIKLFIFNLGYLPHSDQSSVTRAEDTLVAFKKAHGLLKDSGYIIMTFYLGHEGGKDEYYLLTDYFKDNGINVIDTYRAHSSLLEPVTYIIKKR